MFTNAHNHLEVRVSLSLKERQRQEREQLILQVASEMLMKKGYYETSMEEIAARVGIAKGTVYSHFPSKEELVVSLIERNFQKFLNTLDKVLVTYETPRAKLETLVDLVFTGLFHDHAQLLSSAYNAIDLKRMIFERSTSIRGMWNLLVEQVSTLIDEGKEIGEFSQVIPTSVMVCAFFGLFSQRNYEKLVLGESVDREEMMKYLKYIFLRGVLA